MINHKNILITTAATIIARPILEYAVCPYVQNFQSETLNSLCNAVTVTASLAPTVVGVTYGARGLYQQVYNNDISTIVQSFTHIAFDLVTPAGLGMVAVQSFYYDRDTPVSTFLIGVAKSSFEVTVIGVISNTLPLEKTIVSNGLIAATVATATNVLHYTIKGLINGGELSFDTLSNATDYAFGYAIARPLYQTGNALLKEHPVLSAECYFAAPVARGFALGIAGKGSVLVPGSNFGIISNALDGAAIATVSLSNKYIGEYLDASHTSSLIVNGVLFSAVMSNYFYRHSVNSNDTVHDVNETEVVSLDSTDVSLVGTAGNAEHAEL